MVTFKACIISRGPVRVSIHSDCEKILLRVPLNQAAGPDNMPGHVLQTCANQIVDVVTDIEYFPLTGDCSNLLQASHHHPCTSKICRI